MAKFDYNRPAATAKRLLDRFGQAGAISRSTPGGYDPETGPSDPVELQSPCTVALLEFDNRQIDGELVKIGDRRALIAPDVSFEPDAGDVLAVASEVVQVVRNRPLKPAGIIVLHDCVVRAS